MAFHLRRHNLRQLADCSVTCETFHLCFVKLITFHLVQFTRLLVSTEPVENADKYSFNNAQVAFAGVVVSVLATGPKGCGFKTR
jgi:hypothetical protein